MSEVFLKLLLDVINVVGGVTLQRCAQKGQVLEGMKGITPDLTAEGPVAEMTFVEMATMITSEEDDDHYPGDLKATVQNVHVKGMNLTTREKDQNGDEGKFLKFQVFFFSLCFSLMMRNCCSSCFSHLSWRLNRLSSF